MDRADNPQAEAATSAMAHATTTMTNPSRIAQRFADLRRTGEMGLVAYLTAGDPSLAATEQFVLALAEAGADVIELGVPFSDPVADGPVIQRASERALRGGTTLAGVLSLVKSLRAKTDVPLVLFSYYNPVLQMGLEKFARRGKGGGRRWRADHRPHARGSRRISRGDVLARPRHDFSRRAHFDRRAPRADRRSRRADFCT